MEAKDIRDLSDEELSEKLRDAKEALFNLRFQLATSQLDNPMKLKDARRLIAKVQTVRRERELETAKAEAVAKVDQMEGFIASKIRCPKCGSEIDIDLFRTKIPDASAKYRSD